MRPRKFDASTVVEQALEAFWFGGLANTSIDDLQRATGLSRSSVYSFVGARDAWLRLAIDHYVQRLSALLEETFANSSLHDAVLKLLLDAATDNFAGKGCLLANGINELHGYRAEHLDVVQDGFAKVLQRLGELIGQVAPELPDAERRAAEIMCTIIGLRTMQRAGVAPELLKATAEGLAAQASCTKS